MHLHLFNTTFHALAPGFGKPFIKGVRVSDEEIACFMSNMGFEWHNPRNWTYIYLSDMHDENVIKSDAGITMVVFGLSPVTYRAN